MLSTKYRCGRFYKDRASTFLSLRVKSRAFNEDDKLNEFLTPLGPLMDPAMQKSSPLAGLVLKYSE